MSKHSHSEVGFLLVFTLGPAGWGYWLTARGGAVSRPWGGVGDPWGGGVGGPGGVSATGGGALATWGGSSVTDGGHQKPPCLANIEFGKADEEEQLPKWSRGLPHGSFPRNSLW